MERFVAQRVEQRVVVELDRLRLRRCRRRRCRAPCRCGACGGDAPRPSVARGNAVNSIVAMVATPSRCLRPSGIGTGRPRWSAQPAVGSRAKPVIIAQSSAFDERGAGDSEAPLIPVLCYLIPGYGISCPPLTSMIWPVTKPDSASDARYRNAPAHSSAVPRRFIGIVRLERFEHRRRRIALVKRRDDDARRHGIDADVVLDDFPVRGRA